MLAIYQTAPRNNYHIRACFVSITFRKRNPENSFSNSEQQSGHCVYLPRVTLSANYNTTIPHTQCTGLYKPTHNNSLSLLFGNSLIYAGVLTLEVPSAAPPSEKKHAEYNLETRCLYVGIVFENILRQ